MLTENHHNGSLLAQDQYMRELQAVRIFEPLTEEEESKLIGQIVRARCEPANQWLAMRAKHARDRLVEAYQPLILSLVKRYTRLFRSMDLLDLVQEANVALLESIEWCDPARGRLSGLVSTRVKWALSDLRFGRDCAMPVQRWQHVTLVRQYWRVVARLRRVCEEEPSYEEVACEMGVAVEDVRELVEWESRRDMLSLQMPVGLEQEAMLGEVLGVDDPGLGRVELDEDEQGMFYGEIQQVMEEVLTQRQQEVLRLRYGIGEEGGVVKVCDVAAELGVGYPRVAKHEEKALARLRSSLELIVEEGRMQCKPRPGVLEERYTVQEASRLVGVSVATLLKWIHSGLVPADRADFVGRGGKPWMLSKETVEQLLASRSVSQVAS